MENYISVLGIYIVVIAAVGFLAAALPFALWYYIKAKSIAPYLQKIEELKGIIDEKKKEKQEIQDELDGFLQKLVEAKEIITRAENLKDDIQKSQEKLNHIKEELFKLGEEYSKLKKLNNDLQVDVTNKQQELANSNLKLGEVEKELKEIIEEKNRINREVVSLKTELSTLEGSIPKLREEKDRLKEDIKELNGEKEKLQEEVNKLEAKKNIVEDLEKEEVILRTRVDGLRKEEEEAKIKIATANAIQKNEEHMWDDLKRPIASITTLPRGRNSIDECEALKYFKRKLDESGYIFSERTIKAFHTSLLCGGTSPLVVLSGISGTGKSLLPSLYAKAFNINFLPVAVQPRWDSPQDMFGFYNHMEYRFKATEFSRLLWQFDRYNNTDYKPEDQNEMPLSIVLLDEMNIARVEYYFSELLSKLEIRNAKCNNEGEISDEDRKAAEIELEYGSSNTQENANARRLFVNYNIILVGTMNEDESTQTLSSKVIDRSNVIRFGIPEKLESVPNPDNFNRDCDCFISFGDWKSWKRKQNKVPDEITIYIDELKRALDSVDRGFGHRIENSIKEYVRLYPGEKNHAIADQIEMKILPKLNGVDIEKVRNNVRSVLESILNQIGDNEILKSFDSSLNSDDSAFFTWRGVRR